MILLAIETSTHQGSVAVLRDGVTIFNESCGAGRSHSSLLFATLERALKALPAGEKLDQIAVGLGPGSYAGVRIAISAATGLALATGAKLLGVNSLAALAEGEFLAVGDARRQSFSLTHVRGEECVEGPLLLPATELATRLPGTGLPVFTSEALAVDLPVTPTLRYPEAERLARLAAAGHAIAAREQLEPLYLREPHITTAKKKVL